MVLSKFVFFVTSFLFVFSGYRVAGTNSEKNTFRSQDEKGIIAAMNKSADDWNAGNLEEFMAIYDANATFMTGSGPIGVDKMRENYNKVFFVNGKPKQNLRFEEMIVKPLGSKYALLLGKFVLSGNNLKELSGRYSVVFVKNQNGWKMFHDHSG